MEVSKLIFSKVLTMDNCLIIKLIYVMSAIFKSQLEILENEGIPVKALTAIDLYPYWEDSDPRLKHFGEEEKSLSVLDVAETLEKGKNPKYRLLLCTFIEGLGL